METHKINTQKKQAKLDLVQNTIRPLIGYIEADLSQPTISSLAELKAYFLANAEEMAAMADKYPLARDTWQKIQTGLPLQVEQNLMDFVAHIPPVHNDSVLFTDTDDRIQSFKLDKANISFSAHYLRFNAQLIISNSADSADDDLEFLDTIVLSLKGYAPTIMYLDYWNEKAEFYAIN